jgi:hypothetical protein
VIFCFFPISLSLSLSLCFGPRQKCFSVSAIDCDGATNTKQCARPVPVTVDGIVVTSAGTFQSLAPMIREMWSVVANPVSVGMMVPAWWIFDENFNAVNAESNCIQHICDLVDPLCKFLKLCGGGKGKVHTSALLGNRLQNTSE